MRRGHSPTVKFPRALGIEAIGLVEEDPLWNLPRGSGLSASGRSSPSVQSGERQQSRAEPSSALGASATRLAR